jgi:FMN reductase [NAD(P)H]
LLGLPRLTFPVTGMTLGWPEDRVDKKPRLPLRSVLHWESYNHEQEEENLHLYDKAMVASGIYNGRQVPVPGKPNEMEDYGWTEHSARRVSRPMRMELRAELEKQGFALK